MLYHPARVLLPFVIPRISKREIIGQEYVPRSGSFIVVANHHHPLDPWIIVHAMNLPRKRIVRWTAGINLFSIWPAGEKFAEGKHPSIKWLVGFVVKVIVTYSKTIPVERKEDKGKGFSQVNKQATEIIEGVLRGDHGIVGVFPEGGLGRVGNVYPGFIGLAYANQVPILPVRITADTITFLDLILIKEKPRGAECQRMANAIMASLGARIK